MTALEKLGCWVIRTPVSRKRSRTKGIVAGEPGMPDLCLPALGWMEVKLPGKELDPDQVKWHARAEAHGIRVTTVRSVGEAVGVWKRWVGAGYEIFPVPGPRGKVVGGRDRRSRQTLATIKYEFKPLTSALIESVSERLTRAEDFAEAGNFREAFRRTHKILMDVLKRGMEVRKVK